MSKTNKDFFIVENINIGRKNSLNWVEDSFNSGLNDTDNFGNKQFLSLALGEKKLKLFLFFLMFSLLILLGKSFYCK